jgi:hypothetical protein
MSLLRFKCTNSQAHKSMPNSPTSHEQPTHTAQAPPVLPEPSAAVDCNLSSPFLTTTRSSGYMQERYKRRTAHLDIPVHCRSHKHTKP